jgi:hypothetical protein
MSDEIPGQCRYFLTYSGVKLPFNLLNELESSQIENRITFFRGYFDEQGRLAGLQKMVYGEIEMEHRYAYHASGVLNRAEIIDADSEVSVRVERTADYKAGLRVCGFRMPRRGGDGDDSPQKAALNARL